MLFVVGCQKIQFCLGPLYVVRFVLLSSTFFFGYTISINISSSLEVDVKWSLSKEEEWLLLEKDTKEKCLWGAFCYIALIKLLSYILESSILPSLHLSPFLLSWFFFSSFYIHIKQSPKITTSRHTFITSLNPCYPP
jgi:hypothetical protein